MTHYTTTSANVNSAAYRADQRPRRETTAQTMRRLRQSIAIITASGGNPQAYEKALKGLVCPTCANEGDCPDCGKE